MTQTPIMSGCLVCGAVTKDVISFGRMPLGNGFLRPSQFADEYFWDLEVRFCPACSLVQWGTWPDRPWDADPCRCDPGRLEPALAWRPGTTVWDGLNRTRDWLLADRRRLDSDSDAGRRSGATRVVPAARVRRP